MTIHVWLSFLLTSILISLTPGAGAISSMSSGLSFGSKQGVWNIWGLQLALIAQLAVVAAGLGALLASSDFAFTVIKWFGVIYLLYLGYKQWQAPVNETELISAPRLATSLKASNINRRLLCRGFIINASNPKAILFILAIVPQFLDITKPLTIQYLLLGSTMVVVDVVVMFGYTSLATRLAQHFKEAVYLKRMNRCFGLMFGFAAALLAAVRRV